MSAHVIDFAGAAARRHRQAAVTRPVATGTAAPCPHEFKFWAGASGRRYVHTLHGLIDCPEVINCNVLLVRRDTVGRRKVLHVGRLEHDAPSLNLAEIRYLGATLGANEVHVHMLAETAPQRRLVELDLQTALACSAAARAS